MIGFALRVIVLLLPFALIFFVIARLRSAKPAVAAQPVERPSSPFSLESLSFGLLVALTVYVATLEVH
ncbi:hypothetical protein [Pseudorhodobacter sp.]|uniref:hypothetical protein n=1 Tax=Pseudorhodobacter sp. TaxID=1934400 RepID=UPI0026494939|nr:hypothetical protein [Pseudorhodobacter sp.]MDN5788740.1 hypothetical protein [Pseudorhodobacter sp.]